MRAEPGGVRGKLTAQPLYPFALFLARVIGCTLEELLMRMSGYEFGLWLAEYRRSKFAPPEVLPVEDDPRELMERMQAWPPRP